MIYLLYGLKDYLIKKEIKKIADNFDKNNISIYDLNDTNAAEIIDDCNTISLFENKKLVICENASIFTRGGSKDSEPVENYLNNPNPNTTLIFTVYNETIDGVKKITKLIKKIGTITEFNNNININDFVKDLLKDYKISSSTVSLIIDRVGNNPLTIENEINKLKIYKSNEKEITKDDIINVIVKNVDVNIFNLLDAIVKNEKATALESYYEMLKINEEPIKIIIMLANQFRIMYQTKELSKKGLTQKDIATTLKIHPYRVQVAMQNSYNYTSKELLQYINDLSDMDYNIKSGKVDKNLALELFILKK